MTENNESNDGIKRSKARFDPVTEKRDWSIAASEEYCKRIARNTGKRLIEIIDTEEDSVLPIVCIFEGYLDD